MSSSPEAMIPVSTFTGSDPRPGAGPTARLDAGRRCGKIPGGVPTGMRAARGRIWIVALAATLLVPIGVEKAAQAVAASTVTTAQIHSKYETAKRSISRDIGISAQLPDGHQLWLFGDTGIWQRDSSGKWHQGRFIPGTTPLLAKGAR